MPKSVESRKKGILFITTLILSGALISCSTSKQGKSAYKYEARLEQQSSDLVLASNDDKYYEVEKNEKKILFSALLSIAVGVPDTTNSHLEKIAKKYNDT